MDKNFQKLLTCIVISYLFILGEGSAQLTDGIAAVVNEKVITLSQVREQVRPIEEEMSQMFSGVQLMEKVKEARYASLNSLIERELIISEFKTKGFIIPDQVVEEEFEKRIKNQFGGDRSALIKTLQSNGITVSNYKEEIKNQMIVGALRARNVSQAVIVSPYRIEQYYQENIRQFVQPDQAKIRIIYMRKSLFKERRVNSQGVEEEVDPQYLIMQELLEKIETGSDFANLARTYSDGSQRVSGGDMGWVSDKTLRAELSEAVFSLRPGQNTKVVTTDDGYYIARVEDFRKATVKPLEEVRTQIEVTLLQEERQRLQQEWIDKLRQRSYIKTFF